ncbi:unnamed protein product [Ectocarpus fasciculatus]
MGGVGLCGIASRQNGPRCCGYSHAFGGGCEHQAWYFLVHASCGKCSSPARQLGAAWGGAQLACLCSPLVFRHRRRQQAPHGLVATNAASQRITPPPVAVPLPGTVPRGRQSRGEVSPVVDSAVGTRRRTIVLRHFFVSGWFATLAAVLLPQAAAGFGVWFTDTGDGAGCVDRYCCCTVFFPLFS